MSHKLIAIIPARGGSKRIPRKNLQPINGKPMIYYPISVALASGKFSSVLVSTDDSEIAQISNEYGAITPFLRESGLADDWTPTIPVIRDAISKFENLSDDDIICCIYPTSIFLTVELLSRALEEISSLTDSNFIVSICTFDYPIQRALKKVGNNIYDFFDSNHSQSRSQDLEPAFHDAAQFYIARKSSWMSQDSPFKSAIGFQLNRREAVDIDTWEDLDYARHLISIKDLS